MINISQKTFFYRLTIPVVWAILCILSYFNSGDEHGLFALGPIISTWIGIVLRLNSLEMVLLTALIPGILILFGLSIFLDKMRFNKILFSILFIIAFIVLFGLSIEHFSHFKPATPFEKMRYKHRSVFAVVVFVCHHSLYVSIFFSILIGGIKALFQRRNLEGKN